MDVKNWPPTGSGGVRLLERRWPNEPTEIAPGVFSAVVPVPFPPGGVGVYALADRIDGADAWTIVDTGLRSAQDAWRELLAGPLAGRPIRRVIVTHHHPDHIGLAGWMQAEFGAELWTTRTAWLYARMMQLDAPTAPHPETERFYRRCGYDADQLERQRLRGRVGFAQMVAPLPPGYRRLKEDDELTIGGRRWRVLIGDGHAPEHALLYCAEDEILIAGDQILPKISPNIGVYPNEPDADPLGDWLASSEALAARLHDDILVLPGHGSPFFGAATRLQAVVAEHEAALGRLEGHLETPRRVVDCFSALYERSIGPSAEGLATVETLAHLNRLAAEGRATRRLEEDGALYWRRG